MSLRQRVLSAIHNGVSRQPAILRSSDQNEDELNTHGILSKGVGKRPPTEDLADLGAFSENAFIHHINRDVTERYIVVIDGGVLRVFDSSDGSAKTVNGPGGFAYLAGGKFRAVTVADYTFIVNTEKTCLMSPTVDATQVDSEASRWLPRSSGGLTGSGFAFDVLAGSVATYLANKGPGTFSGEVTSVEKLPADAPNGSIYKVTGSVDTGFTTFYVRRVGAVWEETVPNGLRNHLDQNTMPFALVREGDGTFTFAPFSWAPRRVGSLDTNPEPTFIGRSIRDVFFYQNRLGLLVDENVVFSCAGDFGNFWRNTVLDAVASDVVDVAVTTSNVALLNYALPFNDGIMAFADQVQFSITNGEDGLTPSSVAIDPVTRYEVNLKVRPVSIGSEVYYAGNQNGYSVIWEYTRLAGSEGLSAAEITAHVPDFIPEDIEHLIAAPNMKALFALTGGRDVFCYQFYWNGNEKVISAWRRWRFSGDVVSGTYLAGYLYLLVRYGGNLRLERMNLAEEAKPAEQDEQTYLDRRVALTGTYVSSADKTTFTFPYAPQQSSARLLRGKASSVGGALVNTAGYEWLNPTTVRVPGQIAETITAGEAYEMRFQFSRQFPLDYQNRPLSTGRLTLRTFTVNYVGTGFFRAEVSPYGALTDPSITEVVPSKLAAFDGMVVGSAELELGRPAYHTGKFSFQVFGDAAQCTVALTNDTHVASTFVSAEWEGFFQHRALR